MEISIIAAVDLNGAIGYQNRLLFHLSADLKRFKELTTGHTIVMGRRTFESLPKGALPNRRNVVLSTREGASFEGAETFSSLDEALQHCAPDEQVFIIGGASVYRQAIGKADHLCLTEIKAAAPEADAYFPSFDRNEWHEKKRESHLPDEKHAYAFDFVDYVRG